MRGRYPVVPFDHGESIYLGAPVHFIIDHLVNTDFVLQEPPKHAFYDNRPQITINGFYNPTRPTARSSPSRATTRPTSRSRPASTPPAKLRLVRLVHRRISDGQRQAAPSRPGSATSTRSKRPLTSPRRSATTTTRIKTTTTRTTASAPHADRADRPRRQPLGRLQTFDVWRYRVYGVSVTDARSAGQRLLARWCSPARHCPSTAAASTSTGIVLYENGNILSYPPPSTGAFTPSDLGAYKVPCPAENDPACVLCDINTDAACADFGNGITLNKPIVESLVPAAQTFFDGTSGLLSYDYKGTTGRAGTFGYSHTLAESVDVKVGVKAKVSVGVFTGKAHASVDAELHNSNSWSDADERIGDNERHRHHPQPLGAVRRLDARLRLLPGLLHRAGRHDQSHARGGVPESSTGGVSGRASTAGSPTRRSTSRRASRPFTARPTCSSAGHPTTSSRKKLRGFFAQLHAQPRQ